MSIRKLPEDNRRINRLNAMIEQCVWRAVRERYQQFDMHIASIEVTKDLRLAHVRVFSLEQSEQYVLETLHQLRVVIQKHIASHKLRNTPVLMFYWDAKSAFFYKLSQEPPLDIS
jgi:ribosome-binding factor A